jgi:hypothetical protein
MILTVVPSWNFERIFALAASHGKVVITSVKLRRGVHGRPQHVAAIAGFFRVRNGHDGLVCRGSFRYTT